MSLGVNLKNARKKKGLTQSAVAEKLGIDDTTISKYENDKSEPDLQTLDRLATIYGCSSVNELISGKVDFTSQLISSANKARQDEGEQSADSEKNIGRAFLGGADKYTEEELDLARAAAKAAVEAYRKAQKKREEKS